MRISNKRVVNFTEKVPGIMIFNTGEYSESATYTGTPSLRPRVFYGGEWYVLGVNGNVQGKNPAQSVALQDGTWLLMDRYENLIAGSISISDFAEIDQAIFYNGFFFSKHGKDYMGRPSTDWQSYPNGSFFPNFILNFKTGNVVMNDAEINNASINNAYVTGKISNTPSDFIFVGATEDRFLNFDKSYHLRVIKTKQGDEFYYGVARLPRAIHKRDMNAVFTITAGLYSEAKILKIGLESTQEYGDGSFVYPTEPIRVFDSSYNYVDNTYMFLHTTQAMTFTALPDTRWSAPGKEIVPVVWKPNIPLDNIMTSLIIRDKKAYIYSEKGEYCIREELPFVGSYRVIGRDILDLYPITSIIFRNSQEGYTYKLESSFPGRNIVIYNGAYRLHIHNGGAGDKRVDIYNMHQAINTQSVFLISNNIF